MPGSIQVSVLDFKELPSSSNFVKVSLGKVEHEAGEKGTFSFPLTNLRDNLIITIMDSEGNQVAHSGVRTISIIEKGIWDDLFPIEGGGLIHMKLQFVLSDEERKRIRSMREYAMKKKQDEILNSRLRDAESAKSLASSLSGHEVSDVLRITSSQDYQRSGFNGDAAKAGFLTPLDDTFKKASESSDGVKEESFQRQSFTNATDRMEEASFSLVTEGMHQKALLEDTENRASQSDSAKKNEPAISKPSSNMVEKLDEQNLEEKTPSYIKRKPEETEVNSDKNNETYAAKSKPSDNVAEKLEKQNLEKKTSNESKPPHSSRETKVNTIKNDEIQLQQTDAPKRLQDASSPDAGSSRSSVIAEKIKSFSPKLAGEEPDKQGPPEKNPRNIKKMISVFESSISQDRVALKPVGTKAYRVGTVRLLKDHAVNTSEMSGSTRLRNSFSTGDLRKNLFSVTTKGEQAGFKENAVEPSETNMQSKGTIGSEGGKLISDDRKKKLSKDSNTVASIGMINEEKVVLLETNAKEVSESSEKGVKNKKKVAFTETNTKEIPESSETGVNVEKKVAFAETNAKGIPKSSEKGVNDEKKVAFAETNTKEIQESSEKGVNDEKNIAFTETNTKGIPKSPKEDVNNEEKSALTETIPKSRQEDATVSGRMHEDDKERNIKQTQTLSNKVKDGTIHGKKTSKDNLEYFYHEGSGPWIFPNEKRHFCVTAQKCHQENTFASIPESIGQIDVHCGSDGIVKRGEAMARVTGNSSPKSSDEEDSTGSLGQAIKIALVVGFGVLVLLFRQREPRNDKKKGNNLAVKNQVFMNKRGSIGEHPIKIGVLKLS
ncbi:hypothetical protein L6452_21528 [Arctium lappa]|uniref:Uncharacterized protein n=1 Tax=Arctium lappa TaxID=4217 RepID=A0ACB9AWP2_ARCLA|nr:hypothetical protein L6452_21528 [Arctium lappa]